MLFDELTWNLVTFAVWWIAGTFLVLRFFDKLGPIFRELDLKIWHIPLVVFVAPYFALLIGAKRVSVWWSDRH